MELSRRVWATNCDLYTPVEVRRYVNSSSSYSVVGRENHIVTVLNAYGRGWAIPNFHAKVRRGELLPCTPWRTFKSEGSATGSFDVTNGTSKNWTRTVYSPVCTLGYSDLVASELECEEAAATVMNDNSFIQEAAAAIYSKSGYDALTAVAEFGEVIPMFIKGAKRLLSLSIPKNWRSASNDWLESRYGWRTFFYDCKNLKEAIDTWNDERKARLSERKGCKTSSTTVTSTTTKEVRYYTTRVVEKTVTVFVNGCVTADVDLPRIQVNPFQTAWELIPYSFVVDWFLSVGKTIAAASLLSASTNYSASRGYKVEITKDLHTFSHDGFGDYLAGSRDSSGTSMSTLKVRTPSCVPLTPHFTFRVDTAKVIDLIAMLIQKL